MSCASVRVADLNNEMRGLLLASPDAFEKRVSTRVAEGAPLNDARELRAFAAVKAFCSPATSEACRVSSNSRSPFLSRDSERPEFPGVMRPEP